jgi:signal transduction histidine kinase
MRTGELAVKTASKLRFLINPISLFIGLQTLSITTMVLWVVWFIRQEDRLKSLLGAAEWSNIQSGKTVLILVVGCVLLGGILVLAVVWFFAGLRQSSIIKQQRNFLSSVTHEVRSPLASIQLAIETIEKLEQRGLDPKAQKRLLAGAHQDIARLTRLVNQILIASRLDRGITVFGEGAEKVNIPEWLPGVIAEIASTNGDTAPKVVLKVDPETSVYAPKETLRIIIENLVQNAFKYAPGSQNIEIEVAKKSNAVTIAVKDRGIGLDPSEIKHLFRIFRRGERAMQKAIPGTGLGLYIVDSMTRIMGGRVRAESPGIDQGSTFTLELPSAHGRN